MKNIIKRLSLAAKYFPVIEEQPHALFVDSIAEIKRLQERVNSLQVLADEQRCLKVEYRALWKKAIENNKKT